MDTVDVQGKVIDLESMENHLEGTITLHFTPTNLEKVDKIFLLDFISSDSRASLYLENVDGDPYLSMAAKSDEELHWKQQVDWQDNRKVFIAVTWDIEKGSFKVYVDEKPFKAFNLSVLGFDVMGEKLVIGSDYQNHYPGNFNISM